MDVIEKFLNEVSWKFDKGYPDITNEQDILMLERLLKEIGVDLNEADTGSATLFESALVKALYNLNNLPIPENAIDPSESSKLEKNPNMVSKAEKICGAINRDYVGNYR